MAEPGTLVALGVLTRPHGVRGELRLRPYNPDSTVLFDRERVWLRDPGGGESRQARILAARQGPNGVLVALDGVTDRDRAQELRGHEICVPRDELPPLEGEDEHYVVDLVGLQVKQDDGTVVGTVVDVIDYPSVACLRVRSDQGEREVPLVDPWVQSIDVQGGEVTVHGFEQAPLDRPPRRKRRRGQ